MEEEENQGLFQKGMDFAKENPILSSTAALLALNPAARTLGALGKTGINLAKKMPSGYKPYLGKPKNINPLEGSTFNPSMDINLRNRLRPPNQPNTQIIPIEKFGMKQKGKVGKGIDLLGRLVGGLTGYEIGKELNKSLGINDLVSNLALGYDEKMEEFGRPQITPEQLMQLEGDRKRNQNIQFGVEQGEPVDISQKVSDILNNPTTNEERSDLELEIIRRQNEGEPLVNTGNTGTNPLDAGGLRMAPRLGEKSPDDIVSIVSLPNQNPLFSGLGFKSRDMLRDFAESQGQPLDADPLRATTASGEQITITPEQADALEKQQNLMAEEAGLPIFDNDYFEAQENAKLAEEQEMERRFNNYMENPIILENPINARLREESRYEQDSADMQERLQEEADERARLREANIGGSATTTKQSKDVPIFNQETASGIKFTDVRRQIKAEKKGQGLDSSEINSIAKNRFRDMLEAERRQARTDSLNEREQRADIDKKMKEALKLSPLEILEKGISLQEIPENERTAEQKNELLALQAYVDLESAGTLGTKINFSDYAGNQVEYQGDPMVLSADNPSTQAVVSVFQNLAKQANSDLSGQALMDSAKQLAIEAGYKLPEQKEQE